MWKERTEVHTNYSGKANAAVRALTEGGYDFAYIHVEAPDEMGHQGKIEEKIQAIEAIDEKVLGTVIGGLRMLVRSSGFCFCLTTPRLLKSGRIPQIRYYLLYDSTKEEPGERIYCEKTAAGTGREWKDGFRLIGHLLQEDYVSC